MILAKEAHHQLQEVEQRSERLMDRIKPLSMLGETLRRNLSDIRELINQARRQAASVHKHPHRQIHNLKYTLREQGDSFINTHTHTHTHTHKVTQC